MEFTVSVVMFIIFIITLAAWAIIGLVFWIPILTRATTVFSGMILYATLTHQKADAVGEYLRIASGFYANGFRTMKEAIYPPPGRLEPTKIDFKVGRFISELLWMAIFWLVVLWLGKPELIRPLTDWLWSGAQAFRELIVAFPMVGVAISIGVVALCFWGVYLSHKFHNLKVSDQLPRERAILDDSTLMHSQLDRIWKSLRELSTLVKELQSATAPAKSARKQRDEPTPADDSPFLGRVYKPRDL
ncbi:MAG TPA: hypothetical protein VGN90_03555 [Pyrinomonadaceae bacterium]|jgi:hypothetical protein|nr:hypothetical protein [Pyrinomonadaceae bacterium]